MNILEDLLYRAAQLGLRIVIEPRNASKDMNARKGIESVCIRVEGETFGMHALNEYKIHDYSCNTVMYIAGTVREAVDATERVKVVRG